MRFHSSLPMFAMDSSHRARPNCALSLATASASSRSANDIQAEAMDVDADPEELPTWKIVDGVPFPSDSGKSPRKHALLRSSTTIATSISSESGSPTTEHQPPPRKRTRTSALLQPPVKLQRSPRLQSLPMRNPPSRLPRSTSLLLLPCTKTPVSPKPAEESITYAFSTSSISTVTPQSPLLDLISRLNIPLDQSFIPPPLRRKPVPGGIVLLRNLYKSVVYGLAMKYSVADSLQDAQVSHGISRNMARYPFDIQDALLADRLGFQLTLHGEDINIIAFEIEKISQRTESPSLPTSLQGTASQIPILSYERLVSFILLQKRLEGRSKASRKGTCRKPSKLTQSHTID